MMFDNSKVKFFKWPEFHYIQFDLDLSLSVLFKHNDNNERLLKEQNSELEKVIQADKLFESLNDQDKANYYVQTYDYLTLTIEELTQKQRYSMVLVIFSFIEKSLSRVSEVVEKRIDKKRNKPKSESKIQNYYDFLKLANNIDSDLLDGLFRKIDEQRNIRNSIAHNDGITDDLDNELIKYGIVFQKYEDQYLIRIEENTYINYLLNTCNSFFQKLLVTIDTKIQDI